VSVPTFAESGVPGVEADAWSALFAPTRTPPPVIERLYLSIATALSKDSVRAAMAKQGIPAALKTPTEVAAMLPGEVEKWAAVIRAANLVMD
jgi:tripartite-type tricarboxylate transporter receptor subunit TctC